MGLLSQPVLVLLAVAAAGLLGATLLLWPVLARRGVVCILLRLAMLLALQVCVLGVIFVSVNRSYEFYTSWADLLGTSRVTGTVHPAGRPGAQPPGPVTVERVQAVGRAGGQLRQVVVTGPLSGLRVRGYIYLPHGYRHLARPLPVLVVIATPGPGAASSYRAARVAAMAAAEISAGRMAPALIAMLPPAGQGQACLDVPGGTQAATFFSQDLPLALSHAYPVAPGPAGWAVLAGPGSGYCALQLATAPASPFSVVAAPAGSGTTPSQGLALSPQFSQQDDLLWRLRNWPPLPIRVLLTGPGPASQFLFLARPPMTVALTGQVPLAAVLDWASHALRSPS